MSNQFKLPLKPRYNGSDYIPERDDSRLSGQILRVANCMADGRWRTLAQIEAITGDPAASISAQLRHLRKKRFGNHTVNKDYLGSGLWTYQLIIEQPEGSSA
tara:strand:+ start:3775 stop:4080 length:306 start_codon:yes stop_codon:yes gene_type:complete